MKKVVLLFLLALQMASTPAWAKSKGALTGQININEASVTQLAMLPGVGPSRAQAIVAYRQAHPFASVEDLKKVQGIGDKGFEKLKPFVTLQGPTTAQWQKVASAPATTPTAASQAK